MSEEDLRLFWEALCGMFEHDRSASRGYMDMKGVYVFAHDDPLGNAPSGRLFERLKVQAFSATPRSFGDYRVEIEEQGLPDGVALIGLPDGLTRSTGPAPVGAGTV